MPQDTKRLSKLLDLQDQSVGQRSLFCPDDDVIGAYFDMTLEASRRENVTRHLADCRYCRGRLGMLARLEEDDSQHVVPQDHMARAKQIADVRPRKPWRSAPAWAAAAAILLAVGIWAVQVQEPAPTIEAPDARQLRSADPLALEPRILLPIEDALVDPAKFEVRWTPVTGSLHYELYVMSDAGDLLVHERLDETSWSPTAPLPLTPSGEYYLRVEAHLEDATTVSTGHVLFKVSNEP